MSGASGVQCCNHRFNIESLISVDDRGQMVLPKDLREKAGIKAGEKYAVVSWENEAGEVCCISLIRASDLSKMVKDFLGPVMSGLLK